MKPYLAILIDSFWEAVGNRVLWALLIGWSLLLLGLAPFGYISQRSYQLSNNDIDDRQQLIELLAKGARGEGKPAAVAVASRLDAPFVERLQQAQENADSQGRRPINSGEMAQQLNQVLLSEGLYSEAAFPNALRRDRLQELITASQLRKLQPEELEELNRDLLRLAFPMAVSRAQGEQLWIGYAGFKIGDPLPASRHQIEKYIEPILLGAIIKFGLGILAVFVAIVVTSPMIPETFRSGSLHLLLSKPISRVWLYLAKVLGGCIFVLVNITFVLIGLYLIAGLRFDIWNVGLLACIPILLFVFIIFYSVSALAGLIWGNAIVSVVVCMLFWLFCFSLGTTHDALLPQVEVLPQISRIRPIDGKLLTVDQRGTLGVWNEQFSIWQPALDGNVHGQARTFGPIYNSERGVILTKAFVRDPFGRSSRNRKLSIIRVEPSDQTAGSSDSNAASVPGPTSIKEARETPVWMADAGPDLPVEMFDMVHMGNTVLAVCRGGLYRLNYEKLDLVEAGQKGLFGFKLPFSTLSAFDNIAPPDYYLSDNTRAAVTQAGDGLIVFNSGNLDHLHYDGERFEIVSSGKVDGDGTEAALVQMNAQHCVVARDGLPLVLLDGQLQPISQIALPDGQDVRQMSWIAGSDDLAILTHTGRLWRLAGETGRLSELATDYRGKITGMHWETEQDLWLGIQPDSVHRLDLASGQVQASYVPRSTTLERIYRWIIKPLYIVNPKPAALDVAMNYMLTGNQTQTLNLITNDLEAAQVQVDLWTPIITNTLFVLVILGISCWYVARKEF